MSRPGRLEPFALERFFARYEFSTRYVLCPSDPESMPVHELLAFEPDTAQRFAQLRLGYVESRGTPELRRAIAALYAHGDAERVLVHAGSEEPIFTFMHAVLEPGDHIVVQFPAYQSHYSIAESIGASISRWDSDLDGEGAPAVAALERLLRPETRAIVVTTPNNPTGYALSRAEFDAVVELARSRGLWLFCDEVYRGTEREAERLPAACDVYDRGVSLGGMAKAYGLAGLRIGWVSASQPSLLERMATIKDYLDDLQQRTERVSRSIGVTARCRSYRTRAGDLRPKLGFARRVLRAPRRTISLGATARRHDGLSALPRNRGQRSVLPASGGSGRGAPFTEHRFRCRRRAFSHRLRPRQSSRSASRTGRVSHARLALQPFE